MSILLIYRYLVFGLFVICNAISCSVAVWNLSLAQAVGASPQVDTFLAFLGAFGLVFTFTVVFIEILRKNAVTGRVWFEALWVGIFWIMELSGAAALTAIVPDVLCGSQVVIFGTAACSSTHVLLAFSWISTILLLVYLIALVSTVIIRQKQDAQIWRASVREVCRNKSRHVLASTPNSPDLPRFHKAIPPIAPQPRRLAPSLDYAYRSGMGPEYQIEHYTPPAQAAERPVPPVPAAAPYHYVKQSTRVASATQSSAPAPSLYPQHLNSSLTPSQQSRASAASPPPLGNWPRANAMEQPVSVKRKPPPAAADFRFPPASATSPISTAPTPGHQTSASAPLESATSTPRSARPTGPRRRTRSREIRVPPPLDLTKISSFKSGGSS